MSLGLVSYGASDDSDTSDNEYEEATKSEKKTIKTNVEIGHISDEDDFPTVSSTSAPICLTSSSANDLTNVPAVTSTVFSKANIFDNDINSTSLTSLEDLPAPQPLSSISSETVEDELEDEVKPKASEIASAQVPPTKKVKQPVKITIPSLSELESDETKIAKNTSLSQKTTGLFSLLPAPMHSVKKEINRPLIPHSLTKKPPPPTKSQTAKSNPLLSSSSDVTQEKSSKHMTPFNALTGFDSDSDDEEFSNTANFFCLQSTSGSQKNIPTQSKLQIEEVSSSKEESGATLDISSNYSEESAPNENTDGVSVSTGPEPGALNDAPLDFKSSSYLKSWSGSSYGFLPPVGPSGPVLSSTYSSFDTSVPSNSQYNLANTKDGDEMQVDQQGLDDNDAMNFMNDKEFQRLQGKRKRGMDEAISFVDANVDDYVDPNEVSKHLTEESSYVSHKNKDNMPTAQQRRKKQITYLAYQAKERELELKNAWAQNRLTKKQTQSKYGF